MDLQRQTAACFLMLSKLALCGPGTLSLCSHDVLAVPLAIIGLGGACLSLEADAAKARMASRCGATDFVVDTPSEALRILKNELRQGKPVSVAVIGDVGATQNELLRRGVQPQVLLLHGTATAGETEFVRRGAVAVAVQALHQEFHVDCAATAQERRKSDVRLLTAATDDIALHWLRIAPRLFPRDRHRVVLDSRDAPLPGDTEIQEQG